MSFLYNTEPYMNASSIISEMIMIAPIGRELQGGFLFGRRIDILDPRTKLEMFAHTPYRLYIYRKIH